MKITFLSVVCLSACFSLPPSEIAVWAFCFLFPSETTFELLLRSVCVLAAVFPAFVLGLVGLLLLLCCVSVWLDPATRLEGKMNRDGDDHNSGSYADEEGEEVAGRSSTPALALASATIPASGAVAAVEGAVSLPSLTAGEQVFDDRLFGSLVSAAPFDSGHVPVLGLPSGELDIDQIIGDLLSGFDASVPLAGDFVPVAFGGDVPAPFVPAPVSDDLFLGLFDADAVLDGVVPAPVGDDLFLGYFDVDADFDGVVPAPVAQDQPLPPGIAGGLAADPAWDDLLLGLLAADATFGGLFPAPDGAFTANGADGVLARPLGDDAGVVLPPVAATAAADDDGVVPSPLPAAVPPPAEPMEEDEEVDSGECIPMDIDSDDEDGHVLEDPMDIQEDATMTLRRGGWRRVSPVLTHGRRRRVMAAPLGVPAYRFAGPYTVPWYQGSLSCTGRRRNTQTGALVKTAF